MSFFDRFKRRPVNDTDPTVEADQIVHDEGQGEQGNSADRIEPADREIPSVNARRRGNKVTGILGLVFIGAVGLYLIYQLNVGESRKDRLAKLHEQEVAKANAVNTTLPPITAPPRPPEPQLNVPEPTGGQVQLAGGLAPDRPPPPSDAADKRAQPAGAPNGGPAPLSPWQLMRQRRMHSGMTVVPESEARAAEARDVSAGPGQGMPVPMQGAPAGAGYGGLAGMTPGDAGGDTADAGAAAGNGGGDELASRLQPTITKGTFATRLPDLNFMITKGAFMDCGLETKIDSTVAGMTTCVLSRPVYSTNGKVLLLDAGSKVVGQYAGGIKQGQARIFVLWTRIETPKGVLINLDSPGTDPLGGSGLEGHVDTHFWQRFGGALMLSVIDDAFAVAAARASSDSGTTINLGNTQAASQTMATEALKSTINIPPTLVKNQGDQINIFVARDLDFRTVYGLRAQ